MTQLRNKVQLIGNVGKTPDIKNFESGKSKATFSIATTEGYKSNKGEKVYDTQWHQVVVWGKQAEIVEKYVHKGSEIALEGRLSHRSYEDKDGTTKYITEVIASDILLLDKKKD